MKMYFGVFDAAQKTNIRKSQTHKREENVRNIQRTNFNFTIIFD